MIVDASVAIKWLVPETDTEVANQLLARGDLVAPDLLASEVANAIWKKRNRGEISGVPMGLGGLMRLFSRIEPTPPLLPRATAIALELDHPAYDCFYLALAETTGSTIVSADQRLLRKLHGTAYAALVVGLAVAR